MRASEEFPKTQVGVRSIVSKATMSMLKAYLSLILPDTFISAIVLLAARLCPFKSEAFNENLLNRSWSYCLTILERFKSQINSVKTGMEMLHSLEAHVSQILTMKGRFPILFFLPPDTQMYCRGKGGSCAAATGKL
jgi:hypothetical protein